ncbi:hypothetical protein BC835DRAFT_1305292 [Cytidiella melzeri]|nr:hypothetical protein BC835DRAFT_1305292 [Cytidiella melzeri]
MMMMREELSPPSSQTKTMLTPVQVPYQPYTSKRKQYGWRRKAPIFFETDIGKGISLMDALHGHVHGLVDRHEPILEGCGDKVSYHIDFHGYIPLRCQKYSFYQNHGKKYPNTRAKVVRQIAEAVQDFIEKRQYDIHTDDWRVGPGYIELKDLYLLELRHVGTGCFQPILGVLRPSLLPSRIPSYITY